MSGGKEHSHYGERHYPPVISYSAAAAAAAVLTGWQAAGRQAGDKSAPELAVWPPPAPRAGCLAATSPVTVAAACLGHVRVHLAEDSVNSVGVAATSFDLGMSAGYLLGGSVCNMCSSNSLKESQTELTHSHSVASPGLQFSLSLSVNTNTI